MNAKLRLRTRIVLISVILFAILIIINLYWLQIVNGSDYAKKAELQYVKPNISLLDRGSIFLRTKDGTKIQGATLKSGYKVYVNPSILTDSNTVYQAISEYIDIDRNDFDKKVNKVNDKYEELADKVPEQSAISIKNLKIPGLGITKEIWRVYPGEAMLAHELGILGESASSSIVVGRYGLERSYENVLNRSESSSVSNVFAQLFSDSDNKEFNDIPKKEGDIITTIEPTVQKYLEKVLEQIQDKWKPETTGAIVIDPNTGEIIAMSSLPNFNPNNTKGIKDVRVLSNPLVESAYEMGSIIKPLTMATALDFGAITADYKYDDTGTMILNGKKISNHDNLVRGMTSMQDLLGYSLNIGAAKIALKVGKDAFASYFFSFGFGTKTGIDLPNESSGIVGNLKTAKDVEIATASFGQGIAVSPIAVAKALSILANGGYIIRPHLVKEIHYNDGTIEKVSINNKNRVLKKQTTDEVTEMLVKVVDNSLLKGAIKNDRYSIAAKTGTAQISDPVKGGYYPDRYLHSFFGYFPAYNPKYLVFFFQVYPKGTEYASDTLTEPFNQMTKFLINYYNIAPDR